MNAKETCRSVMTYTVDEVKNIPVRPGRWKADYGGSKIAVARNLEIDEKTAQEYIDRYFEGFAGLKNMIEI